MNIYFLVPSSVCCPYQQAITIPVYVEDATILPSATFVISPPPVGVKYSNAVPPELTLISCNADPGVMSVVISRSLAVTSPVPLVFNGVEAVRVNG